MSLPAPENDAALSPEEEPLPGVDLLADELALARVHLDSGLPLLAETVLRAYLSILDTAPTASRDAADAAYALLAESLWRQQRPLAAGAVLDAIRPSSEYRRHAVTLMVEADALAARGHIDEARGLMQRVLGAVGSEAAWKLRAGVRSELEWPEPFTAAAQPRPEPSARPARVPTEALALGGERTAAARARVEAARAAYTSGDTAQARQELVIALRLDGGIAEEGIRLLEPHLDADRDPAALVLYGDLLAAAGRLDEAESAYERAATVTARSSS